MAFSVCPMPARLRLEGPAFSSKFLPFTRLYNETKRSSTIAFRNIIKSQEIDKSLILKAKKVVKKVEAPVPDETLFKQLYTEIMRLNSSAQKIITVDAPIALKASLPYLKNEGNQSGDKSGWEIVKADKIITDVASYSWSNTASFVKWPAVIFTVGFILSAIAFGKAGTVELAPFWAVGPFALGLVIWVSQVIVNLMVAIAIKLFVASCEAYAATEAGVKYSVSGQLAKDVRAWFRTTVEETKRKKTELVLYTITRKNDLVEYVGSGKLMEDAIRAVVEFCQGVVTAVVRWVVHSVEDKIDDWRPIQKELAKSLSKIF